MTVHEAGIWAPPQLGGSLWHPAAIGAASCFHKDQVPALEAFSAIQRFVPSPPVMKYSSFALPAPWHLTSL